MKVGRCCAGSLCQFPHMQLWGSGHNCSVCNGIVHLNGICSTSSLDSNGDDVFVCVACLSKSTIEKPSEEKDGKQVSSSSKHVSSPVTPTTTMTSTKKVKKPCPKCGGTDHQKSSSRLCKYSTYSNRKARNINTTKEKQSNTTMTVSDQKEPQSNLFCQPINTALPPQTHSEENNARANAVSALLSIGDNPGILTTGSISSISTMSDSSSFRNPSVTPASKPHRRSKTDKARVLPAPPSILNSTSTSTTQPAAMCPPINPSNSILPDSISAAQPPAPMRISTDLDAKFEYLHAQSPSVLPASASASSASSPTSSSTTTTSQSFIKPNFIPVGNDTSKKHAKYRPVVDVSSPDFTPINTEFKVMGKDHRGHDVEVVPSAKTLMDKYWSEEMVNTLVTNSNLYIEMRKKNEPNAKCWSEPYSYPFTLSNMYHFIAVLYYFGLVKLPNKYDYWDTKPWMPHHPIVHELNLTCDCFN